MRHMPVQTHMSIAHNDNINQIHQNDQIEAHGESAKQVTLCPTTPKQCKLQGDDDRQKARSAREKNNTNKTRHRPPQ